jgi:hypothetical protein
MKGSKHVSDQLETEEQRLRDETLIFWGRQQSELEHYASQKALDPMALAARLGELWLHYSGHRDGERMPNLSPERHSVAARNGRPQHPALATEKGDHRSHDDGTSRKRGRPKAKATVKAAPNQVAKRGSTWARFKTPAARRKEALRRMLKRKDPIAKAMVKGLRGEKPKKHGKRDPKKQKIYRARHDAIQRGETPPPLPGEKPKNVFGKPLPSQAA